MEKEKILTKFKLEVHIQRTYYVASNWIWFVLTLNLLEIFRWEKNPDKNNLSVVNKFSNTHIFDTFATAI